ncbi:hypothetical protein LTR17_016970 [Elasticomyces elasticus]|nr:hypothetical protein LTR17_016970 [Elasticomyces elasticus]
MPMSTFGFSKDQGLRESLKTAPLRLVRASNDLFPGPLPVSPLEDMVLQACPTRLARCLCSNLRYLIPSPRFHATKASPPFTTRQGFSKDEDALLLKRSHEKTPLKGIASEMNRTYNSIRSRLNKLREGAPRPHHGTRKYSEEDAKTILSLAAAGTSCRDIAKQYGIPTRRLDSLLYVLRARQSKDHPQYGAFTQAADRARIISLLLDQRLSIREVARRTKWSLQTVRKLARSHLNPQREPPRKAYAKYTAEEDAQILELREKQKLSWREVANRIPGRGAEGLRLRFGGYLRDRPTATEPEDDTEELK